MNIKKNQNEYMDARDFIKLYNVIIPTGLVYHKVTFDLNNNTVTHQYKLSSGTPTSLTATNSSVLTNDRNNTQTGNLNTDTELTYKAKKTNSISLVNTDKLTTSLFRLTVCQVKTDAPIP